MILQCPSCSARYVVDPVALAPDGRTVRCAKCAHTWFQEPPDADDYAASTGMASESALTDTSPSVHGFDGGGASRPALDGTGAAGGDDDAAADRLPPLGAAGTSTNLPALPGTFDEEPRRRSGWGWVLLIVVLALIVGGGYFGRQEIVTAWPPSALLYETVGIPVVLPGDGLQISEVETRVETHDGIRILTLQGMITNVDDATRPVPRLRADVSGENGVLESWTFEIPEQQLNPGQSITFASSQPEPAEGATQVTIRFDTGE